jgi:hypothetical protein
MSISDTKELRKFLTDKLNDVADGKIDSETTKGIANLAQQIYNTLNIELKTALARQKLEGKDIKPVEF